MEKYAKVIDEDAEVVAYLVECYEVTETRAAQILKEQSVALQEGKKVGSYVWYVGDRLAGLAGLEPIPEVDDEEVAYDSDEE